MRRATITCAGTVGLLLSNVAAAELGVDPPGARRVKAEARVLAEQLRLR